MNGITITLVQHKDNISIPSQQNSEFYFWISGHYEDDKSAEHSEEWLSANRFC